mgnify:CR=1 FL=1
MAHTDEAKESATCGRSVRCFVMYCGLGLNCIYPNGFFGWFSDIFKVSICPRPDLEGPEDGSCVLLCCITSAVVIAPLLFCSGPWCN